MKTTNKSHAVAVTRNLAIEILRSLDTCTSRQCADLLERGDDASVLELTANHGGEWREFMKNYLAVELVSKADWLNLPGTNRSEVAIQKFLDSEASCYTTNTRFVSAIRDPAWPDPDVASVFHRARRKIARILGDFSWDEAERCMAFGPGASIGVTRKKCHAVHKFGLRRPTVTGECAIVAQLLIGRCPQWSKTVPVTTGMTEDCFEIVRGSRITTVSKNAKTDRVIAIEPLMNMYVQKGIGRLIRRSLRTVGIDLDSQVRNQELARKGSLDGSLATIDLSAASDSISRSLVEWLFPESWVTAMKICRSSRCVLPSGEELFLQKFSSMGNGFTFELESLLFWALLRGACDVIGESSRDCCVYGDDIIAPVGAVPLLIRALSFAGFKTNEKKSFWEGRFRESCGKHYYAGHDVTPFYIRKVVDNVERKLWLANSIKRCAWRMLGMEYGLYGDLRNVYDEVVGSIEERYKRLSIPEGFGDGGLVRDFDEARPRRCPRKWDGYRYLHLQRVYHKYVPGEQPALTAALSRGWSNGARSPNLSGETQIIWTSKALEELEDYLNSVPERIQVQTSRYRIALVKSFAPRWGNLGPWVAGL